MKKIIRISHRLGWKTFMLEAMWRVKGFSNPIYKVLGASIGKLNDLQMKIHTQLLRYESNTTK